MQCGDVLSAIIGLVGLSITQFPPFSESLSTVKSRFNNRASITHKEVSQGRKVVRKSLRNGTARHLRDHGRGEFLAGYVHLPPKPLSDVNEA